MLARKREYRVLNPEKYRATDRKREYANREVIRERNRKYRAEHPDKVEASRERWRAANPDRAREVKRNWFVANVDKAREAISRWTRAHPEKCLEKTRNYRAKKRNAVGSFTGDEWKHLVAEFNGKCAACGTQTKLEADHMLPLSRGGTNTIDNIQPLCRQCNTRKATKTIDYRKLQTQAEMTCATQKSG